MTAMHDRNACNVSVWKIDEEFIWKLCHVELIKNKNLFDFFEVYKIIKNSSVVFKNKKFLIKLIKKYPNLQTYPIESKIRK